MTQLQVVSVVLMVLAVLPLAVRASDTKGVIVEKSFLQSVQDCVEVLQVPKQRLVQYLAYEFPPDDETKCLIFCVGTDLRWWNNTCGLQVPAIVNFFQPVQGDRQYEKRTRECLDRNVRTAQLPNSCCEAYETFQCYFREFGNLVTCPQYVPATKLQATQAALDCLVMLRVPVDLLQCYSGGELPDVPETRCVYHCIDLRTGLYTPENGIQLSRFYVRDNGADDLRYLSKDTKACRDRVRQSGCNTCSEVYGTHQECLSGLGESGYTSGLITEAAKLALTNLGIPCREKVVAVPVELGYSYASYQPVPVRPCEVCVDPEPVAVVLPSLPPLPPPPPPPPPPSPLVVSFSSPPFEPPRKPPCPAKHPKLIVQSTGSYPTVVTPAFGNCKPAPFAKELPTPALRPQLVYYPPTLPELGGPCPAPPPTFSTFSVRSHGPYPSCACCKSKP